MTCAQCRGIREQFGERTANRELRKYDRRGPTGSTRVLLEELEKAGMKGASLLDIGGGVGILHHELLKRGATTGVHVDASPGYLEAAKAKAEALGHGDRMAFVLGDFVDAAPDVEPADAVTLDRVLCCYHDLEALVRASASKARRFYAVAYLRERWWIRVAVRGINFIQWLTRKDFRVFDHASRDVDRLVAEAGLDRLSRRKLFLWQVTLYGRAPQDVPGTA
jgi:magnesium-protoporphyrin O-methyltransferase